MTTRRAGELILAVDFTGSGTFSTVGALSHPPLALNAAIVDLVDQADPELRPVLVHVLATRIAGRCAIDNPQIASALKYCMPARIAMEWSITIPAAGALHALFVIAKLEKAGETAFYDLVLQLAGKPSFEGLQAEDADSA
jgi:predicted secreted protein